jgi:hypothetical protein
MRALLGQRELLAALVHDLCAVGREAGKAIVHRVLFNRFKVPVMTMYVADARMRPSPRPQ